MNHILGHVLQHAQHGPPLKKPKNPVVAFVAGVLFGPFGVGLYLQNFRDFAVPMLALVAASVGTVGLAAPVGWLFAGVYGALRAAASRR